MVGAQITVLATVVLISASSQRVNSPSVYRQGDCSLSHGLKQTTHAITLEGIPVPQCPGRDMREVNAGIVHSCRFVTPCQILSKRNESITLFPRDSQETAIILNDKNT